MIIHVLILLYPDTSSMLSVYVWSRGIRPRLLVLPHDDPWPSIESRRSPILLDGDRARLAHRSGSKSKQWPVRVLPRLSFLDRIMLEGSIRPLRLSIRPLSLRIRPRRQPRVREGSIPVFNVEG